MAQRKPREPLLLEVPRPRLSDDEVMELFYGGKAGGSPPLSSGAPEHIPSAEGGVTPARLHAGLTLVLGRAMFPERSGFFVDHDVEDQLARLQDPYEYIVYRKLWRHSFGSPARLNCCRASHAFLLEGSPFTHRNSIIRALEGLCRKRHIIRIHEPKSAMQAGKLYRVLHPVEILNDRTAEGIALTAIPEAGLDVEHVQWEGKEVLQQKGMITP